MRRISKEELKELGFVKFNSTSAMVKYSGNEPHVIVSYGLIVAVKPYDVWESCEGYHDYSATTAKQVTQITGVNTSTRRKTWNIFTSEEDFIKELQDKLYFVK